MTDQTKITPLQITITPGNDTTLLCKGVGVLKWSFNHGLLPLNAVVHRNPSYLTLSKVTLKNTGYYVCEKFHKNGTLSYKTRALVLVKGNIF